MAYTSRKRLGRKKCGFGDAGAILAAAAINAVATTAAAGVGAAATANSAKQQAEATKQAAQQSATATTQAAKVNAQSISEQNENNTENVQNQIDAQKDVQDSTNDILRDMNMNLAIQAGQQNNAQRKEQAKIQVKYGRDTRKRLGITPKVTLQDDSYLMPVGQDVALLRGGTPLHPEDQTHGNSHKNTKRGGRNKGTYLKVNGEEIEAEAGGLRTPGEGIDLQDGFMFSERPMYPDGTSPVERLMMGEPKEQVKVEQEMIKQLAGVNSDGTKLRYHLKYGGRPKMKLGDYTYNYNGIWDNGTNSLVFPQTVSISSPSLGSSSKLLTPSSSTTNVGYSPSYTNRGVTELNYSGNTNNSSTGSSFWNTYGSSVIGAGANLLGTGLSVLGNSLASGYMRDANNYANTLMTNARNEAADTLTDAYSQMHGISVDGLNDEEDIFKKNHAIGNVRAGRFNINPELQQSERDYQQNRRDILANTASGSARRNLLAQAQQTRQDTNNKAYATQTNQVEGINQDNIKQLNQIAMANAENDVKTYQDRAKYRLELAEYNNNIENAKISGIANAKVSALTGNAQSTGQTAISNAGLSGSAWSSGLSGFGNVLANIGKQYYDTTESIRSDNAKINQALAFSSNPYSGDMLASSIGSNQELINTYKTATGAYKTALLKEMQRRGLA